MMSYTTQDGMPAAGITVIMQLAICANYDFTVVLVMLLKAVLSSYCQQYAVQDSTSSTQALTREHRECSKYV